MINRRFCVAPMMGLTDRYCRFFYRQLTSKSVLYTEMVTSAALFNNSNSSRWLAFDEIEHPIALQLGGSCPKELAYCCQLAQQYGFDEINLNVGCPSAKVQSGRIGACLMLEPHTVAQLVSAMKQASTLPVTVKHRLGVDQQQSYQALANFVETVAKAGCNTFIVHARIALLKGLSPLQNRTVPPLKYEWVYQLKSDFPELEIIINGGIDTLDAIEQHLSLVDGVMLGRAVYQNPYLLNEVDRVIYQDDLAQPKERAMILQQTLAGFKQFNDQEEYIPKYVLKHLMGLYHHCRGSKYFRHWLNSYMHSKNGLIDWESLIASQGFLQN